MRQEELEKTQRLEQHPLKESPPDKQKKLEDTQSLSLPPFPPREHRVRELDRLEMESAARVHDGKRRGGKRVLLLAAGFLGMLFLGFFLAGYVADRSEQAENERRHQLQMLQTRQQQLAAQAEELQQERQKLQAEKKQLEKRRQELAGETGRLDGIHEKMQEENPSSPVGKFFDKISGKEKERGQAMEENRRQRQQAARDADSVDLSIAEAQELLDDVNAKLDTLASMKQEADNMKQQMESAYAENKDVIDAVASYAMEGAKMLRYFLDAEK